MFRPFPVMKGGAHQHLRARHLREAKTIDERAGTECRIGKRRGSRGGDHAGRAGQKQKEPEAGSRHASGPQGAGRARQRRLKWQQAKKEARGKAWACRDPGDASQARERRQTNGLRVIQRAALRGERHASKRQHGQTEGCRLPGRGRAGDGEHQRRGNARAHRHQQVKTHEMAVARAHQRTAARALMHQRIETFRKTRHLTQFRHLRRDAIPRPHHRRRALSEC